MTLNREEVAQSVRGALRTFFIRIKRSHAWASNDDEKLVELVVDALSPSHEAGTQDEFAWLIEKGAGGDPWYYAPTAPGEWVRDHLKACRFARKEDAEAVQFRCVTHGPLPERGTRVCEHGWITQTAKAGTQEYADDCACGGGDLSGHDAMCPERAGTQEPVACIRLGPAEIQSGYDRVKWAEGLIRQLPENHDGRNSWLLNYAGEKHEADKCKLYAAPASQDATREALERCAKLADKEATNELLIFEKAADDTALSDSVRMAIQDRAIGRQSLAKKLAATIRALASPARADRAVTADDGAKS